MENKQSVISKLQELNISYQLIEHDPVYTVEEIWKLWSFLMKT